MRLPRRTFLQCAGAAISCAGFSCLAMAETYPARPITLIVPFAPGGPTDVVARMITERMRSALGQPVIIENVSGADGSIGVGRAARAKPDGYTLNIGTMATQAMNGAFYALQYDSVGDFAPIAPLVTNPQILFARGTMPAQNLTELTAWLKANPNRASAGIVASSFHVLTALFQKETATQFAFVPYRGTAPAMQDLAAGQIDLLLGAADALPLLRAGSIKAYAITSDTRLALAPEIPTFAEQGLAQLSFSNWFALFAPKGTPGEVIVKLNAAAVAALADPAVRSRFASLGFEVFPIGQRTPEALAALLKSDADRWRPIIKELGIRAE